MGGLVKTVIKTQNGELLSTVINTDGINTLMWHRAFRAKDVEAIKPILNFLDKDRDDGSFAPYEYGIIYIDWVADKIISCQTYTCLLNAYCSLIKSELEGLYLYPEPSDPAWPKFPEDLKNVPLFREMLKDGIVTGLVCNIASGRQVWEYGDKLEMKGTLEELLADAQALGDSDAGTEKVNPIAFRYQLPFEVIDVDAGDMTLCQQIADISGHVFCSHDRYLFDKFHQANNDF